MENIRAREYEFLNASFIKMLYFFKIFFLFIGIMAAWLIAGIATTVFICLFDSEDFRSRLNMKIPESMNYKLTLLAIMVVSGVFCWIWEVSDKTDE